MITANCEFGKKRVKEIVLCGLLGTFKLKFFMVILCIN